MDAFTTPKVYSFNSHHNSLLWSQRTIQNEETRIKFILEILSIYKLEIRMGGKSTMNLESKSMLVTMPLAKCMILFNRELEMSLESNKQSRRIYGFKVEETCN